MKNCFLLIIYFFFLVSFAQNQVAKGIVVDKNTTEPIPYVNISILNSQVGTSSREDGKYVLFVSNKDLEKEVHISSLGYKDTLVSVSFLLNSETIYLEPSIEQLDEVMITKKHEEKLFIINRIRKKDITGGFATGTNPWKIALFFPYKEEYKSTLYLKTLKLYLNHNIFLKSHPSKFRVRLFSIDKSGLPENDLVYESIIIETKKRQREAEIDISHFNLTFPLEGLFIAFEWLHIPFNEYEIVFTVKNEKGKHKMKRYAPTLSATSEEIKINKIAIYSSGIWKDGKNLKDNKNKFLIPAISVTLSN